MGKNLLDEEEFARLQENLNPGEMALMVLNTKGFSFISDEFIPQTTPEHLRVSQGGFPTATRDIDFYSFMTPHFHALPDYNEIKYWSKSKGGLSLDKKWK